MENHKKSTEDSITSKFVTKKCIEVNHSSNGQYSINKKINLKTLMLRLVLFVVGSNRYFRYLNCW